MKFASSLLLTLSLMAASTDLLARMGETQEQLVARYGKPVFVISVDRTKGKPLDKSATDTKVFEKTVKDVIRNPTENALLTEFKPANIDRYDVFFLKKNDLRGAAILMDGKTERLIYYNIPCPADFKELPTFAEEMLKPNSQEFTFKPANDWCGGGCTPYSRSDGGTAYWKSGGKGFMLLDIRSHKYNKTIEDNNKADTEKAKRSGAEKAKSLKP